MKNRLLRTELLLGSNTMTRISQVRVIIFGVGGVGSWCAESLVRSGICNITLVDNDIVAASNCNRQLMATPSTIGEIKVEAMRKRLLELNPQCNIDIRQCFYDKTTADSFNIESYDYVVDAIDSLDSKANLILHATTISKAIEKGELKGENIAKRLTLVSSMGAALRINPFAINKAEFWKVKGDALARALRNRFKQQNTFPSRKFMCVYSEETPMQNKLTQTEVKNEKTKVKPHVNGTVSHVTAIFGLSLAGIIINDIYEQENKTDM